MSVIRISQRWDDAIKEYVPDKIWLEGDDDIVHVTLEFLEDADPRYVKRDGKTVTVGDITLEILGASHYPGAYKCKVVKFAQAEFASPDPDVKAPEPSDLNSIT